MVCSWERLGDFILVLHSVFPSPLHFFLFVFSLPCSSSPPPPCRTLDCEAHRCEQLCHRGPCQPCPRSPTLVKTCPCGQTQLLKLLELGYAERQSCSDPVPSCGKTCNKPLACGSSGESKKKKKKQHLTEHTHRNFKNRKQSL